MLDVYFPRRRFIHCSKNFGLVLVFVIGFFFGIIPKASADATWNAQMEQFMSTNEKFLKELGSPEMFKTGPFKPATGDTNGDNLLMQYHEMYEAMNAGDFTKVKEKQAKLEILLKKWEDDRNTKLSALKKNQ